MAYRRAGRRISTECVLRHGSRRSPTRCAIDSSSKRITASWSARSSPTRPPRRAGFKAGDVLLALERDESRRPGRVRPGDCRPQGGCRAHDRAAPRRGPSKRKGHAQGASLRDERRLRDHYGAVASRAGRLRTIVTRPKGAGKHPALFLIQGIGLASIDNPAGGLSSYKTIVDDFTRHGFVTLRVDKPGCGDSEGGPARDVDFDTELDGYRQALKMLKARADVDPDRVFIFGHSMGGVMAPLLAAEMPVRGIIVYGTIARTWPEYWLENLRRQMELAGASPAAIDRDLRAEAALATYLYAEKKPPRRSLSTIPTYASGSNRTSPKTITSSTAAWRSFASSPTRTWGPPGNRSAVMPWRSGARPILFPMRMTMPWSRASSIEIILAMRHSWPWMTSITVSTAPPPGASFSEPVGQPGEFNPAVLEVARAWAEKMADGWPARRTRWTKPPVIRRAACPLRNARANPLVVLNPLLCWRLPMCFSWKTSCHWDRLRWCLGGQAGPRPRPPGLDRPPRQGRSQARGLDPRALARAGKTRPGFAMVSRLRQPAIWSARGTAAMNGFAGIRSSATSSTTSNGDSRPVAGKKGYNSGVYARNSADARIYHQAQTGDASGGYLFGTTVSRRAQAIQSVEATACLAVKPAGEWNTFEITCRGSGDDPLGQRSGDERWHDCEVEKGYVGLEAEGWRIEFRNVKLKPLDSPAKLY